MLWLAILVLALVVAIGLGLWYWRWHRSRLAWSVWDAPLVQGDDASDWEPPGA